MKIKDVLDGIGGREPPIARVNDTIRGVLEKMLPHAHTRLMYVVDEEGRCKGVISLGALTRHLFSSHFEPTVHARFVIPLITAETAEDIMNTGLIYATRDEEVEAVIKEMIKAGIKEIPVLDGEKKIVGDITMLDLLKYAGLD
jgi:CBS domain-containing protein